MFYDASKPLIVQSDGTLILESSHECFQHIRGEIVSFAELVKSPEPYHVYQISNISLWNAAATGSTASSIMDCLTGYARMEVPLVLEDRIHRVTGNYGKLVLVREQGKVILRSQESKLIQSLMQNESFRQCIETSSRMDADASECQIDPACRGQLKVECIKRGYPVVDNAGYEEGRSFPVRLRDCRLRNYQAQAASELVRTDSSAGGSGVVVLPCGAGKTIVGIGAMAKLQCETLILTTNATSVAQWKHEIESKTDVKERDIGEYTGSCKKVRPVTVATYQILTHRNSKQDSFRHMKLFKERNWGLIIYDEVHLLPAPVFRVTADIQATRRLGLSATLVREDGREEDVFSLIGPKVFDMPWRELEQHGWINNAYCIEMSIPLNEQYRQEYAAATPRQKHRVAAENPDKLRQIKEILTLHPKVPTLIIGQYLDQLRAVAKALRVPLISGKMPHHERNQIYDRFRDKKISLLVVSKVANFAVDLPDARVAIQISGSFGSRQEEAQRLGRILRPKKKAGASYFYSLISAETKEEEHARRRKQFLLEQGYVYQHHDCIREDRQEGNQNYAL